MTDFIHFDEELGIFADSNGLPLTRDQVAHMKGLIERHLAHSSAELELIAREQLAQTDPGTLDHVDFDIYRGPSANTGHGYGRDVALELSDARAERLLCRVQEIRQLADIHNALLSALWHDGRCWDVAPLVPELNPYGYPATPATARDWDRGGRNPDGSPQRVEVWTERPKKGHVAEFWSKCTDLVGRSPEKIVDSSAHLTLLAYFPRAGREPLVLNEDLRQEFVPPSEIAALKYAIEQVLGPGDNPSAVE